MTETITTLIPGRKYTAFATGVLKGVRVQTSFTFVAARTRVEEFIRERIGTPDQDRIFINDPLGHGTVPRLVVTGTIREAVSA